MNEITLIRYESARRALQEAVNFDDVKEIRDKAEAVAAYARQAQDGALVRLASEIKVRAERRAGEMLREMPKAPAGRPKIGPDEVPIIKPPTLQQLGISKNQSSNWQKLAEMEEEKFEAVLEQAISISERVGATAVFKHYVQEAAKEMRARTTEKRRAERVENLAEISLGNAPIGSVGARYPVIYADPPWRYEHAESESRAIENQYPTMTLDEIKTLPIGDIVVDDCVLFLWATSPKLAEAMEVLQAWDFSYRTCAVWDKQKIGMGYYLRQQHELLLIATRGKPPTPKPADRPASIFSYPRGPHSSKPIEVYEMIEKMYAELPKLELFCRSPRTGWAAWGNEARRA